MLIVTDKESASKVQKGDQYAIDVWPDPPISDEEVATLNVRFAEAQKLHDSLQGIIDRNLSPEGLTKEQLQKMTEKELVVMANAMGIDAKIRDYKSDTIDKILERQ